MFVILSIFWNVFLSVHFINSRTRENQLKSLKKDDQFDFTHHIRSIYIVYEIYWS